MISSEDCFLSTGGEFPLRLIEQDSERFRKLIEFRNRVLKENVVVFFDRPEDLERKLEATLRARFSR